MADISSNKNTSRLHGNLAKNDLTEGKTVFSPDDIKNDIESNLSKLKKAKENIKNREHQTRESDSKVNSKKKEDDMGESPYLRIGTDFFKIVYLPLASKDTVRQIKKWSKSNIRDDHGNEFQAILNDLPKFDGFCCIPSHIDYQRDISGCYNQYEPINISPAEGSFDTITYFLKHVFGEQYDYGLDYMQLVYMYPTQMLPVLCLVSEERNTGKTTFLNFLKAIYKENMTINTNEDFRNQFNSGWANKLFICIDEVLLDKREDSERIKALATAKTTKSESKGKDKVEIPYYGKIILCSNNEVDFIKIDQVETRYWVRKIESLSKDDPNFLEKLTSEIPAFIHYLQNRQLTTSSKSRMWFTPNQIHTEALEKLKRGNRNGIEIDILSMLSNLYYSAERKTEGVIQYQMKDICDLYYRINHKSLSMNQARSIIKERWGLKQEENSLSYQKILEDGLSIPAKGRYFTFKEELFKEL